MEEDEDFINLEDSEDDLIELAPTPKKLKRKEMRSPLPKSSSAKKSSSKRSKKLVDLELSDSEDELIEPKPKKPKKSRATNKSLSPPSSRMNIDEKPVSDLNDDLDLDDIQWEDVGGDESPEGGAEVENRKTASTDLGAGDEHELDIKMDLSHDVKSNEKVKNEKKRKRESTGPKKRRGSKLERSYALDWHHMHLLSWLGHAIFSKRQSERNQLHQAIMLSYLPAKLFQEVVGSDPATFSTKRLNPLMTWFNSFFKIVEPLKAPTRVVPTTKSSPIDLTDASENAPPSTSSKKLGKGNSNISSSEPKPLGEKVYVHRRFSPQNFSNTSQPVVTQQVAFQAFSVLLTALGIPHRTVWWLDQLLAPSKFADFSLVMPKVRYSPYRFTRSLLLALHSIYKPKTPATMDSDTENQETSVLPENYGFLWFELFNRAENRWEPVDMFRQLIDFPQAYNQKRSDATKVDSSDKKKKTKLSDCDCGYIIAVGQNGKLAHVSSRYSQTYSDPLFKMGDWEWVMEMIKKWNTRLLEDDSLRSENVDVDEMNRMDEADAAEIKLVAENEGFPKSLSAYKNHPLYVLERDLLKFEVLRPDHAASVHKIGEHDVFLRRDVSVIHTADKWIQEGLQVKPDAKPVMEYIKFTVSNWDMAKKKWLDEDEAEKSPYYGDWQVEPYQAPIASNGIVPKNKYGNVYMFKTNMLPIGCVHLKGDYPQMDKSARKIGIDIAPAMVGWTVEQYWSIPVLDGWIICEENVQAVMDAWIADSAIRIENQKRKIREKATQHWLSLTKQLILKAKFDMKQDQQRNQSQTETEGEKKQDSDSTLKDNNLQGIQNSETHKRSTQTNGDLTPAATPTTENMNFGSVTAKANAQHTHSFPAHLNITDALGNVTRQCTCGYSDSTQRL